MKTIAKMLIATIVAFCLLLVCFALGASDRVALAVYVGSAIGLNILLGTFDVPEKQKQRAMRKRINVGAHGVRDAA